GSSPEPTAGEGPRFPTDSSGSRLDFAGPIAHVLCQAIGTTRRHGSRQTSNPRQRNRGLLVVGQCLWRKGNAQGVDDRGDVHNFLQDGASEGREITRAAIPMHTRTAGDYLQPSRWGRV